MSGQAEKTTGERCFDIAKEVWETPPDRVDRPRAIELRRELTRLIHPQVYLDADGCEVEVFGPVPQKAECIEACFQVTFRYLSGERRGNVDAVPLFGDNGFFDSVTKVSRYTVYKK